VSQELSPSLFVIALVCLHTPGVCGAGDAMHANLIDFSDPEAVEWLVINDGVMGGVSQGSVRPTENGTGVFSGVLSLENRGGFASVRAVVGRRDLSAFGGLEIRVRGDGRTYQLRVRTDDRYDGIAYRADFATVAGEWTTTRIPFAELRPTFRGRLLDDVPPLDTSRIHQVGFLLADKQPGPFRLEIDSVRAWPSETEGP
jgi:monofunctional biosynthetic peptidoglycan transglycosylase